MGILAWIIVGFVAGWLAERITGRRHGLLTNLVVGIVGAVVGGALFTGLLGFQYYRGLNLATILVATVGAVAFLYVLDLLKGRSRAPDRYR
jgi:uncharacterized membrane protein YeaQ/YmgE (transglycosylase-associated protein family)